MKLSTGERIFNVFNIIIFTFISLIMLLPVVYVLSRSFDIGATSTTLSLIPKQLSLFYYNMILHDKGIYKPFLNSIFITIVGTTLSIFFESMGAYTLSKKNLPGFNIFIWMIIIPMMFSGGLIPSYILNRALGLIDTYAILIISGCIGAWNMLLIRNYYKSLPESLAESARLDGAEEFQVFWNIIFPLSKPVIAAIALFTSVGYWNTYMTAVIYINDPSKYTFPVKLRQIISVQENNRNVMEQLADETDAAIRNLNNQGLGSAITILSIIPVAIAYPYLQKHFAKGMMVGSIKG